MMIGGTPKAYERPKPSLRVTDKDLPDIKKWEVGKKYHVNMHVEMQSHKKGDEYSSDPEYKNRHEATLRIHSIKSDGSDASADTD
jgi:hypothetical protein